MFWEVLPGTGLDSLTYGDTSEEVEQALGPPEEISEYKLLHDLDITRHYWSLGLSAYFNEEDDFKLGGLHLENPAVSV